MHAEYPTELVRLVWLTFSAETPHLRRRAHRRVFRANRQKAHMVTEARGDAIRPILRFRARPFEAMVAVTKLAGEAAFPI